MASSWEARRNHRLVPRVILPRSDWMERGITARVLDGTKTRDQEFVELKDEIQ